MTAAIAWLRTREWIYVLVVLALWSLIPEVRRLIDWKVGYNSISVVSVLPLLALAPLVVPFFYGKRLAQVDWRLLALAWLWLGGFTFSLAVALTSGNTFSAIYAYLQFLLPMAFGLWAATIDARSQELYDRVASFLLWLGTPLALYAAFQFVAPPAWDVAWMRYANITSIGVPLPYQFRPFSTLNGPGAFADFLVAAIVINLPRLRNPRPVQLAQLALLIGTLGITMVRSDWVALVVGVLCYIALTPNRGRNLTMLAAVGGVCAILAVNASALLGSSEAGNGLSTRFSTLTDLNNDISYNERSTYFGAPLVAAAANPFGTGLGTIGTAAKLGANGSTLDFDNGYIARFTEMGYFGTACYLAAIVAALVLALRRWSAFTRGGEHDLAALAAAALALQAALIFLDISSDHHNGFAGIFFWLTIAFFDGRAAAATAHRMPAAA